MRFLKFAGASTRNSSTRRVESSPSYQVLQQRSTHHISGAAYKARRGKLKETDI